MMMMTEITAEYVYFYENGKQDKEVHFTSIAGVIFHLNC